MFPDCSKTSQTQATCSCVKPNDAIPATVGDWNGLGLLEDGEVEARADALVQVLPQLIKPVFTELLGPEAVSLVWGTDEFVNELRATAAACCWYWAIANAEGTDEEDGEFGELCIFEIQQ